MTAGDHGARINLRPETADDGGFLLALYGESRAEELQRFGWPEEQARTFLRMQFDAQTAHYRETYPGANFDIVESGGEAIGRFYVHRGEAVTTLIDISLLARRRRAGIGSALMEALLAESDRTGVPVDLHVAHGNPAARLYRRLGFAVTGDDGLYLAMRREARPPADGHPGQSEAQQAGERNR
jgi:ribosomal protein S18 acetylase RimI-like enzyme